MIQFLTAWAIDHKNIEGQTNHRVLNVRRSNNTLVQAPQLLYTNCHRQRPNGKQSSTSVRLYCKYLTRGDNDKSDSSVCIFYLLALFCSLSSFSVLSNTQPRWKISKGAWVAGSSVPIVVQETTQWNGVWCIPVLCKFFASCFYKIPVSEPIDQPFQWLET